MTAGTAPECGDPESGNLPGRPAVHWDIGRGGLRPIRTRGVTMMAFRTGRRMLVLGSIVTILAAGAVAGGLSFKRSRAHRGAAGAPQGGAVLARTKTKGEPGETAIPVTVTGIAR